MIWPKIDSEDAYGNLSSYCNASKNETGVYSESKGDWISSMGLFQLWCWLEILKGRQPANPNLKHTFNSEKKSGRPSPDNIRVLEVIYSYGPTFLKDCPGVLAIRTAEPKISGRDLKDYQSVESKLEGRGFSLTRAKKDLIDYQPKVREGADEIYEEWVRWQADTFHEEAHTLLGDPAQLKTLEELRSKERQRLDGSGFFKSRAASSGKFLLYPKAKDGRPLLVFSANTDTRVSDAVKAKIAMLKSSADRNEYRGEWSQSGNRKSITFRCADKVASENLLRQALQVMKVDRGNVFVERG